MREHLSQRHIRGHGFFCFSQKENYRQYLIPGYLIPPVYLIFLRVMSKKINRNDPCPCGSGRKYKNCHEGKQKKRSGRLPLIFLAIALLLAGFLIINPEQRTRTRGGKPGQVWSEEHGHWHDAPARQTTASQPVTSRPPGPAPEGKVWSQEHGHWHDLPAEQQPVSQQPANQTNTSLTKPTRPPGPAPEGKVWSEEHGHWHDLPTAQSPPTQQKATRPPGPAPEGKVWSEEHGHWHNAPVTDTLSSK